VPDVDGHKTITKRTLTPAVSRTFEATPLDVGAARRFVVGLLGDRPDADAVALCVSELATNAVVHARSEFVVSVSLTEEGVYVEVFDRSPAPPRPNLLVSIGSGGRGLMFVDTLSIAWGSERTPTGKVVWFETDGRQHL
jgi:anti-sigma regulatory factor (Ser/Thr protein kinase)